MPCCMILALRLVQSHLLLFGVAPQRSNWSCPLLAGLPGKVSYDPSCSASSQDASHAAK